MPGGGQLRERIRFDRRRRIPDDGYGNTVERWEAISGPVAARIKPAKADEEAIAQRMTGTVQWEITIRNCQLARALLNSDRAVNLRSGATYNLSAPINTDERRRFIDILATTGRGDG